MSSAFRPVVLRAVIALGLGACAAPQTQIGSVSQDQIAIEQARQQQFALEQILKQQLRVQNVANPLLRAAVSLCGSNVRPLSAFVSGNAYQWKNDYFKAAMAAGYTDTLVVMNVTPGQPADRAGLKAGDRILAINGSPIVTGPNAVTDLNKKIQTSKGGSPAPFALTYRRGADTTTATVKPEMACAYSPQLVEMDEINAAADGQSIFVTTGLLRFVADDDELAVVIGHELGHNAMHHSDAKKKNAMLGALFGAVVDVAAATQGVNTHGDFTNQWSQIGSQVFSQDFEREADYVGLYVLALAGKSLDNAPNLWRRMAVTDRKSIKFATSHPTSAERFVRLETWRGEIARKIALGQPLAPEMKNGPASGAALGAPTDVRVASTDQAASTSPSSAAGLAANVKARSTEIPKPEKSGGNSLVVSTTGRSVGRSASASSMPEAPRPRGSNAIIGAPTSDSARVSAVGAFAEANRYMGSHQWNKAEAGYRETLALDGSKAAYHAALGKVLMVLGRYEEAEAEFTAAVLLDLDNTEYRKLVKSARSSR
jgi:tetratricopeptide (TPR) repeat protein